MEIWTSPDVHFDLCMSPRRWAVINDAVVLEFWEVHELEFYWDSTLESMELMMDLLFII